MLIICQTICQVTQSYPSRQEYELSGQTAYMKILTLSSLILLSLARYPFSYLLSFTIQIIIFALYLKGLL